MREAIKTDTLKKMYSLFGAAEAGGYYAIQSLSAAPDAAISIPVWLPAAGVKLYLLDKHLEPVPDGILGEVYVSSDALARGYHNQPERTAYDFIDDPFSGRTGARLYRTGDLARRLADGSLENRGRCDGRIFLRGLRVERAEIESALVEHGSVSEAAVVALEPPGRERGLAAFIGGAGEAFPPDEELRDFLKERLPEPMIPSEFIQLQALPRTASGEIDYQVLSERPEAGGARTVQEYVAPRNPTEAKLADIWMETFGVDRIGVHDNFFRLGGHSLLATQVVARISDAFRVELSLRHLFQGPTIAGLAPVIAQLPRTGDIKMETAEDSYLSVVVQIQEGQGGPPLFCIHPGGGQVMDYRALAAAIDPDRRVYGLQSRALADVALEHTSVDEMAIEYAAAIRRRQPAGPYYLLGWSFGGVVAVSVARRLEEQGERVAFIGLVDAHLISEHAGEYVHDPLEELALLFGGVLAEAFVGLGGAEQADIRARFSTLSLDERIREALALGRQRGLLSSDLPIERAKRQLALVKTHQRLLREHRPRAVQAPLFLWWAQERADGAAPRTDWELYTTGRTQAEMTGGNHFTCLRPPNLRGLAERIRKRITEIESPTSSGAAIE